MDESSLFLSLVSTELIDTISIDETNSILTLPYAPENYLSFILSSLLKRQTLKA